MLISHVQSAFRLSPHLFYLQGLAFGASTGDIFGPATEDGMMKNLRCHWRFGSSATRPWFGPVSPDFHQLARHEHTVPRLGQL